MTSTERISRDTMLIQMANIAAMRGTCNRLTVGAIISREGRVLSTGYNGAPSHLAHCDHTNGGECTEAVHAEANAIVFAARHGVAIKNADIHITHSPCIRCAHLIINAGIERVVYGTQYRDSSGMYLMEQAGIMVRQYAHLEG